MAAAGVVVGGILALGLVGAAPASTQEAGDTPTCPDCLIRLDPVTTVGSLDGPNWIPGEPFSIARDSRGRLYMAYPWEDLLAVFDAAGQALEAIGRGGDGPGEYRNPYLVRVGRSDTVMVVDARRQMSFVAPSGDYVRRVRVPIEAVDFLVTGGGGTVLSQQPGTIRPHATEAIIFHVFDASGGAVERSFHTVRIEGGGAAPRFRLAAAREPDRFWTVPHNGYEVTQYALDGTVVRRFTGDPSWMRRPPARDGIAAPRPGIYGILAEEGRLWVAGRHAAEDWSRFWTREVFADGREPTAADLQYPRVYRSVVDVLDAETGRLITSASVPGLVIALLPDRHVATYREDDAGVPFVDVYRMTLWGVPGGVRTCVPAGALARLRRPPGSGAFGEFGRQRFHQPHHRTRHMDVATGPGRSQTVRQTAWRMTGVRARLGIMAARRKREEVL